MSSPQVDFKNARIALVYDNLRRPDTTGEHVRQALESISQVTHFLPSQAHEIPGGFDLYLRVDDSLGIALPPHLKPSAWWVIDTHLQYDQDLELARRYDFVFAAQRDGAHRLRRDGIPSAEWLPLACNANLHVKKNLPKTFDFAFIGNLFDGPRQQLLEQLQEKFTNHFVGNAYGSEMVDIYSRSRLIFNRSILNDINRRVFEAAACGSLLLTNDLDSNGLHELFVKGEQLVTYTNRYDLLEKASYYLDHPDERERIAANGAAQAHRYHTYTQRVNTILDACFSTGRLLHPNHKKDHSNAPLTSIIILTHNQLQDTKRCLQSIKRNTSHPYELIVVDNGSTDGSLEYLRDYDSGQTPYHLVLNPTNLGFAAGVNKGLRRVQGDFVLLLNNDTVVTPGWLVGMLLVFDRHPETGIVGPLSNHAPAPQCIEQCDYTAGSNNSIDQFSRQWAEKHHGESISSARIIGFCFMFSRAVLDRIGAFDERFGIGNYEDDDYCLRARIAGYDCRLAQQVFIHHTGAQTFKSIGYDYYQGLAQNWQIFKSKWGLPDKIQWDDDRRLDLPANRNVQVKIDLDEPQVPALKKPLFNHILDIWSKTGKQHWLDYPGGEALFPLRTGDRILVAFQNSGLRPGMLVLAKGKRNATFVYRLLRLDKNDQSETGWLFHDKNLKSIKTENIIGRVIGLGRNGREMNLGTPLWRFINWWLAAAGQVGLIRYMINVRNMHER